MKSAKGPYVEETDGMKSLDGNIPVSMNMWAFRSDVLDLLEKRFVSFLAEGGLDDSKSEFLITTEVGAMLSDGVQIKVFRPRANGLE